MASPNTLWLVEPAAAVVVVVHRGQVVVDERVGVDHLQRAGRGHAPSPCAPPTASAPAMTRTGAGACRPRTRCSAWPGGCWGGTDLRGQEAVEGRVDAARALLHVRGEVERDHVSLLVGSRRKARVGGGAPRRRHASGSRSAAPLVQVARAARARPTPSSKTLSDSSRGRLPRLERVHDLLEPRQAILKLDVGHRAPT